MIDVKNLSFTYPHQAQATLRDVSFRIEPGEIVGFLGPSGAGKSTTQNVLIGLLRNYQGSVRVMDREVNAWGREFYERIGVCFELPNHYLKLSARENLEYFRSLYSGAAEEPMDVLERVGLAADADLRVAHFSKGMKNRLNFARALINRPEILFLDEPTSGLDPVNARLIKQIALDQKAQGRTVFLTTHNMNDADELCDRVAFIIEGAIAAIDSPRALKLKHGQRSLRVEFRDDGGLQRREFPLDGLADDPAFLDLLRGGRVETIHTLETTLERVFIKLTGRELS